MKRNSFYLDKFSLPQNNPLFVSMQIMKNLKKEVHINDLVNRIAKRRNSVGNVKDEVRILKAIGFLIAMGKVEYYKGMILRTK